MLAYFSNVLRTQELFAVGLIAIENERVPANITLILEDWGLPTQDLRARNLYNHLEVISGADLIFCHSDYIFEFIKEFNFQGKLVNLEDVARKIQIKITDPQHVPRKAIEFELAKILRVASVAMREIGILPISNVSIAIIPTFEHQVNYQLLENLMQRFPEHIVLYADIVAPKFMDNFSTDFKYTYNKVHDFFSLSSNDSINRMLVPKHSVLEPNSVYLGSAWRNFLQFSLDRRIVLITPPLVLDSGGNSSAYLASLEAIELEILELPS